MASVQITKPSISIASITAGQSVSLIQTCLHDCFSAIFYRRELFPDKAFEEQRISRQDDVTVTPDGFSERGNADGVPDISVEPAALSHKLQRGHSKRADFFMDWLESGAYEALRKGELRAVQACIHPDSTRREKVLETYTFSVQYMPDAKGPRTPRAIRLTGTTTSGSKSLKSARNAIEPLLLHLEEFCMNLPTLPKERYLSMNLFLHPESKDTTWLHGFRKSRRDSMQFPRASGWWTSTESFESTRSQFHELNLKISSFEPDTSNILREPQPELPSLRDFHHKIIKEQDVVTEVTVQTQANNIPNSQIIQSATDGRARSSPRNHSVAKPAFTNGAKDGSNSHRVEVSSPMVHMADDQDGLDLSTQASKRSEIRKALQNMMQPENLTQGDTQPYDFLESRPAPSMLGSENLGTGTNASKSFRLGVAKAHHKLAHIPECLHRNQNNSDHLRDQALSLAQRIGGSTESAEVILCQCAYSKQEGDMVKCSCCGTLQHLHCYGFTGKEDIRRPEKHFCYICLVDPKAEQRLKDLIDLAIDRRGIFYLLHNGLKGKTDFAESLGYTIERASPMFTHMKDNGYVVAASGSHKAGFKATGKPQWVPASGAMYEEMLDTYFDPRKLVEGYVSFEKSITRPSEMIGLISFPKAIKMPLPATPIAEKRKKTAPEPSSGLDLQENGTKFDTPKLQPTSHAVRRSKRLLEDDETDISTPKRMMTPATTPKENISMESERMIDAAGNPTSTT